MESRKTDCQTPSYPLVPWATGIAVELERNEKRNERRIQMVLVWI